jgi:4-hydroxythreonine-4-phosphate dehydrogenase
MKESNLIKVGITHGDINGIGYEVIIKMLEDNRLLELCTPVIYGSAKIAAFYRKALGLPAVQFNRIDSAADAVDGAVNIVNVVDENVTVEPGTSTPAAGAAAFASLEAAVAQLKAGEIDVLLTAPINKNNIQSQQFQFPGHTEYLEASTDGKALMILFNSAVRLALVTTHLPVSRIAEAITTDAILDKLRLFDRSLRQDFAIDAPRIAVLGLNPHSGDDGLLGTEEKEIIAPAIAQAREERIQCFGPYSADGFFGAGLFGKFDGVLAMYHDQGLAPFKTLSMDSGVNFTAGLPIVRTSPDHGTGYDIAGKGLASEASMREALYAAIDIFRNRRRYAEITANPLRRQYFDKSKDNVVLDLS